MAEPLYYEDLEVGSIRRFGHYQVTREEVLDFARKYDAQPFHLSDEGAAATHFGRLAASGWHTCSMTMAMMVEHAAVEPRSSLGALGIDELRWLKPVYPGDVLSCEMALLDKRRSRSKPGLGILNLRMTTFNQHGEAVLAMKPITLVRARES
ncbi:MAG: MaoC family dehydratase [Novosphingobium sp.]|nr:MaoC family dehydratase [Novosphingobium sp.]MBO9602905.1 MaoC family dehydratase [Novosphingobium sp.]